ncbi:uncharacterized protein K460DRAFT_355323 [Cucurbitaria berberidis CBS 394.84]|uniref:Mid2 domain-containing protein n=1 Tax=Cucurbitaria berberidis CBS 394.84 TaxID=1168544 RepID=A0A9P4L8S9_9PLEO|nr:uncharacterized protein K460DRAFT_355323 [Cucurbitaria berberidis CBS 394.84]KAF1845509.1 hypothetical protein K460DRAFT_355323 [Cucurbitaria berberidis CBS 394.84]
MTVVHFLCAVLAPALARAAAFPWALPEPTVFVPAVDAWSPAPTEAPHLSGLDLFRRQQSETDNTCGFVSGSSASSLTCQNPTAICATNTFYGVHGCCDPASLSSCSIPTTCIAKTAMSATCTDAACSSNAAIVKCTADGLGECYQWLIEYPSTTMTQHGCASSQFTITAQRSWGPSISSSIEGRRTVTVTASAVTTPTSTLASSASSKQNIGTIVGGTIGGCVFLSIMALAVFVWYRRRKAQQESTLQPKTQYHSHVMAEHNPLGFHTNYVENDHKLWQQQHLGAVHRSSNAVPQYPGMNQCGVVEADGVQRPVEAPT